MNLKGENNIEGSVSISAAEYKIGDKTALDKIYDKRNDYRNAVAAVEVAKKKVNMYGNSGLPSLTASYMAETDSINNGPEWGAEISFNLPIGETDNSTDLRNSRLELKEARDKLELKKIEIRDDVENAADSIETTDYALKKTKEARLQTELYYKRMFVRFKQGKLNAAVLKTGMDNLISARQQELSASVDYNMAILKYQVSINDVFESNGIDINEYVNKSVKE
jgi:outer membrane protein TolC